MSWRRGILRFSPLAEFFCGEPQQSPVFDNDKVGVGLDCGLARQQGGALQGGHGRSQIRVFRFADVFRFHL